MRLFRKGWGYSQFAGHINDPDVRIVFWKKHCGTDGAEAWTAVNKKM
jgi:hypothetical protein